MKLKMVGAVIMFAITACLFLSCTKTISNDQYINAMVSIGCKDLQEASPGAVQLLKEQGITPSDIDRFRKKMDPKKAGVIVQTIAARVGECHGVVQ